MLPKSPGFSAENKGSSRTVQKFTQRNDQSAIRKNLASKFNDQTQSKPSEPSRAKNVSNKTKRGTNNLSMGKRKHVFQGTVCSINGMCVACSS